MAGLVPAIHVGTRPTGSGQSCLTLPTAELLKSPRLVTTWMPVTSTGITEWAILASPKLLRRAQRQREPGQQNRRQH
jgi:hypothetical protein